MTEMTKMTGNPFYARGAVNPKYFANREDLLGFFRENVEERINSKIVRLDNIALLGNWGQKLYFDDDMTIRISKWGVNAHGKGRIETEGVGDRSREITGRGGSV